VLQDKHNLSTGFSECGNCGDHSACTACETCPGACQNYLFPYPWLLMTTEERQENIAHSTPAALQQKRLEKAQT